MGHVLPLGGIAASPQTESSSAWPGPDWQGLPCSSLEAAQACDAWLMAYASSLGPDALQHRI